MAKPKKQKLVQVAPPKALNGVAFRIAILTPKRRKHWTAMVNLGGESWHRVNTRVIHKSSLREFLRLAYQQFALHPQTLDALFPPPKLSDED